MTKRASVCLLSGGMDSCVAATLAKKDGDDLFLLSVNYGQVMQRELGAAQAIAAALSPTDFKSLTIEGFGDISKSCRTDRRRIEKGAYPPDPARGIPDAYPPGRDFSFIFMAGGWAETIILGEPSRYTSARVVIGTNADDAAVYPDCRGEAYAAADMLLRRTKAASVGKPIAVFAPLLEMTKTEVLRSGLANDAPVHLSWSCYEGGQEACGMCDPCLARLYAFGALGRIDSWRYKNAVAAALL